MEINARRARKRCRERVADKKTETDEAVQFEASSSQVGGKISKLKTDVVAKFSRMKKS